MGEDFDPSGGDRPGAPCVAGDGWIEPGDDAAVRSIITDDGVVYWHARPECEEAAAEELGYAIDAEGNWRPPDWTPAPPLEEVGGDG